jgi:hypothetical protein
MIRYAYQKKGHVVHHYMLSGKNGKAAREAGPRKRCRRDAGERRSQGEAVGTIDVVHENRAGGKDIATRGDGMHGLHRTNYMQRHETASSADGPSCTQWRWTGAPCLARSGQSIAGRACGMQRVPGGGEHQERGEFGEHG